MKYDIRYTITLYSIMHHVIVLTNCHKVFQRLEFLLRIQTGRGKGLVC